MSFKYSKTVNYGLLLVCSFIIAFSSCAKKTAQLPEVKSKSTLDKQITEPLKSKEQKEKEIIIEDLQKQSIIDVLCDQAEQFILQKNYQDALFLYNQALANAQDQLDENQESMLLSKIEHTLSQTPAKDIQDFIEIKNITIPRSQLLYWLGTNYALENDAVKAKMILGTFLFEYPDHPYYLEAAELLEAIKQSIFKKDTIGCLLPLTGKYAIFGQRALKGIQLAIKELSDKYSKQFKIIFIDTKADPDIAANGVKTLYQKNVAGIIGPLLNVEQAGLEAQKLNIPLIALTQKYHFPSKGDYLFSNFITPQMQVQALGAYLFLELGLKKVAILYPDEKYGKKYMELFWDVVQEYGGEIVGVEPYDGKKTDFKEPIQKLTGQFYPIPESLKPKPEVFEFEQIDLSPDEIYEEFKEEEEKIEIDFQALFIPDSPSIVKLILPQLAFNDATDMYLVGTNLWHQKSLLKDAKGYNKKAIITDGFFNDSQNPAVMEFTEKFESIFDEKPQFLEAISYDTASMLLTFAMDESIDSRQALKDSLQGKRIFEGVTGNTIFDENGIAHRQLFLMTIKRGEFVEITR
jgi:branched-chain amino acid transport system substrate-binding protein